jgi:hypothetical protein
MFLILLVVFQRSTVDRARMVDVQASYASASELYLRATPKGFRPTEAKQPKGELGYVSPYLIEIEIVANADANRL